MTKTKIIVAISFVFILTVWSVGCKKKEAASPPIPIIVQTPPQNDTDASDSANTVDTSFEVANNVTTPSTALRSFFSYNDFERYKACHSVENLEKFLKEEKIDINATSDMGDMPLLTLVILSRDTALQMNRPYASDDTSIISFLIDQGADVNAGDETGQTPLHWAVDAFDSYGDLPEWNAHVASLLIDAGADVNARNDKGLTYLDHGMSKRTAPGRGESILASERERRTNIGATASELKSILGEPNRTSVTQTSSGTRGYYSYSHGGGTVIYHIENGKVTAITGTSGD